MKAVEKIEAKINALLFKLGGLLAKLFGPLLPKFLKKRSTKPKAVKAPKQPKPSLLAKLKQIDFKKRVEPLKQSLEAFLVKLKKISPKAIGPMLLLGLGWCYTQLRLYLVAMKPTTIVLGISFSAVGTITAVGIYQNSEKIAEEVQKRSPASLPTIPENVRPKYHKGHLRHGLLDELALPIFIQSANSLKSIKVELTLESSNRYIIQILRKYDYEVQDYLHSRLEPLASEFSLTDEGKQILRSKVKKEINNYLEKKKIEGKINHVSIKSILAG